MRLVLQACGNVGKVMSGTSIRYWEMAKALSKHHDVTLLAYNAPDITSSDFVLQQSTHENKKRALQKADVFISQLQTPSTAWLVKSYGVHHIVDAYDPLPLDTLEECRWKTLPEREHASALSLNNFSFALSLADAVLYANEHQRDLWTGMLLKLGKISPTLYDADPSLRNFLAKVPFGLSRERPIACGPSIRQMFPIPEGMPIILWGGGIWNWFDPLTLIHAVKQVVGDGCPVALVFMGIGDVKASVAPMAMAKKAIQLAEELQLKNRYVFFNEGWMPYEQRQSFLLEADIGISSHFDQAETRFSFRTRILDYIWAGLPIIATEGDYFAELINQEKLGIAVPAEDTNALAQAIKRLTRDAEMKKTMKLNLEIVRERFYWDQVINPLCKVIDYLKTRPKPIMTWSDRYRIANHFVRSKILNGG